MVRVIRPFFGAGCAKARAAWLSRLSRILGGGLIGAALLFSLSLALAGAAVAQSLVLSNVGNPTSVGTGAGKRAIWVNAGTVGATTVDLVATLNSAALNHTFSTQTGRAALTSVGVEDVWMTWRIFQAGTYDINTDSGGVPIVAHINVQLNDIDGPNNERAYVPICDGSVSYVRVQKTATTGRAFGTITGRPQIFSLVGDKTYNAEPESGVEVLYPSTSSFGFGRRANNGFYIRVSSPTYSAFDTYDYQCADFGTPTAVNDTAALVAGTNTVAILQNDSIATGNPSGNPSEWGLQAVSLTTPAGATGVVVDANGHTTGFTVPGEGTWSYDDTTGLLSFTPDPGLIGSPTPVTYVFYNALTPAPGVASNPATVTLTTPLVAANDTPPASIDGSAGNANVINVFTNDTSNGVAVDPTKVTTTITAQTDPAVTIDTSTGIVTVAAGTPAGTYTIDYQICEITVPTNCSAATVTVAVVAGTLTSPNDGPYTVNGTDGSPNAGSAYANDTLSGAPVDPADVNGTILSQTSPAVTLDPATGIVTVAPNTPAGTYTIDYQICEKINPSNCTTGTVTVNVTAATVTATDEGPFSVDGLAGNTNVGNIFANDTVNGQPTNGSDVTTTIIAQTGADVTLNTSTGAITVASGTPAGTYTIDYQICQIINPSNCDTATVTVTVSAAAIDAFDDAPGAASGFAGNANVVNVFANDTLGGAAVDPADLNVQITAPASNANVQLNVGTGVVSVAAGTPAGSYTITYQICEKINPTSCDTATVTVAVSAAVIDAVDDAPAQVSGAVGNANVVNAFANDTLNGAAVNAAAITASIVTPASNPNIALDPATGTVSVAAGTPTGTYTIDYQICENLNPANCDVATVTVVVGQAVVVANDDTPTATTGAAGDPNLVNVLTNDTLAGGTATTSNVTIAIVTPASNVNVALDPATGVVSVAASTPAGTYTITYQICETLNPGNCDNAVVTVAVTAATINAVNDAPPATSSAGNPSLINAFANDTLNGAPVDPATTSATITAQTDPSVTLDTATGAVSVAPGTAAGSYTIDYQLCDDLDPTNCDSATIAVTVASDVIDAVDDTAATISGSTGNANAINVFTNDTLAAAPLDPATVTASIVMPASNANVALDAATGIVSVAPNTPQGSYSIVYRICQISNPSNCDTATVTVPVSVAPIDAVDDAPPVVFSGVNNSNVGNAFTNDTLNGAAVVASQITASVLAQSDPNVQLNVSTGVISVGATVVANTYTIDYRICETLNPTNCDDATITVTVVAPAIRAVDDAPAATSSGAGNANLGNAFANDTLNAAPVVASSITATIVTPASNANVAMNVSTGIISVAPNTPAGTYTIDYRICENVNPANCDTATITVVVNASVIDALDDTASRPFDSRNPIPGALNVLGNDTLNGSPATTSTVVISAIGTLPAGLSLAINGNVDIAKGTPSGTYTFGYQICETLNPANCDLATVTLEIRKSTPSISGYVFFDANGNGVLDPSEDHLPGYRVELRQNGQLVQQTISDERGFYRFVDFPPGSGYEIVFIDPNTNIAIGRIINLTIDDDTDLSQLNQPINPSGLFYNSATGAPLAGVTVELRTAQGTRLPAACLLPNQQGQTTGANGRYRFDVVSGASASCPVGRTEYRLFVSGYPQDIRPQVSVAAPPQGGSVDASTCPQDAVPGGACQLSASSAPPPVGAPTPYYLSLTIAGGDRDIVNNHIALDPIVAVSPSGLTITKRANVSIARRDDVVSYVIIAANDNQADYGPVDVKDKLPVGLAMVKGSGSVDGAAVAPVASGRNLTFPNLTIPARGSVEIRLSVRIGADVSPGDYVNQAWIADAVTGEALTPVAKATVRLVAEHAFDCGEIIGKVFNDRNHDGIQSDGEKGLPGVRVVTVNGILITTDKHGRFSVPCAELPDQDIGSNFILKLDTRTLPDGYRMTTDNPRVVRLTAGKVTKLNFGATAGNTIRVDVTARAFKKKSAKLSGELADGIGRLTAVTDKKGASLKVTYTAGGEPGELVDARVKNVRAMIAKVWRDKGKALPFEIRVVGVE